MVWKWIFFVTYYAYTSAFIIHEQSVQNGLVHKSKHSDLYSSGATSVTSECLPSRNPSVVDSNLHLRCPNPSPRKSGGQNAGKIQQNTLCLVIKHPLRCADSVFLSFYLPSPSSKNSIKAIKMVMFGMNETHPPPRNSADFFSMLGRNQHPFSHKMEASTIKLKRFAKTLQQIEAKR